MPVSTLVDNYVHIDWVAPFNGGATITGYRVQIRTVANVWVQDTANCDASQEAVTAATECITYLSTLTNAPFSLPFGESIDIKM